VFPEVTTTLVEAGAAGVVSVEVPVSLTTDVAAPEVCVKVSVCPLVERAAVIP